MPMLRGDLAGEAFVAAILLLVGILLGNTALALLSLPFFFLIIIGLGENSAVGTIKDEGPERVKIKMGSSLTISHGISTMGGAGVCVLYDDLHAHFKVKEGNNIGVFWKDRGAIDLFHAYKVEPLRKGESVVGPTRLEAWDAYALTGGSQQVPGESLLVRAERKVRDTRKLRDRRSIQKLPMPVGYVSILGAETTDFKDIREYRSGEEFRKVNWKASARRQRNGEFKPFVNDYEREGKRKVWIFLDCGEQMEVGAAKESAMEHAGNATQLFADLYLAADCMVGLVLFNGEGSLLPDHGRRQKAMISKMLFGLDTGTMDVPLNNVVRRLKGHLSGGNPLYLVITVVNSNNVDSIRSGLNELKGIGGRRATVIVLNVEAYNLGAVDDIEKMAARLMELSQMINITKLKEEGWAVVNWDPEVQSAYNIISQMSEVIH
jgi:uncharacterized protein (DUF58 family)